MENRHGNRYEMEQPIVCMSFTTNSCSDMFYGKMKNLTRKEVIMNPIDHGEGMKTKLIAWKAKMDALMQKVAIRGSTESEKVLRKNQDLKMPISEMSSRIERFNGEHHAWASQAKNIDNGLVDMRGKYVLRTRPSWTGLYGKEPWPRERKQWEKV